MFSKLMKLLKSGKLSPEKKKIPARDDHTSMPSDSAPVPLVRAKHQAGTDTAPSPSTLKTKPRYNKKGLPVFHNDQDMAEFFLHKDDGITTQDRTTPSGRREPPQALLPQKPPKKPRVTRHGFPVLDDCADLVSLMMARGETPERARDQNAVTRDAPSPPDREGLQASGFSENPAPPIENQNDDESFEELLRESLGNKTLDVLLHEKKGGVRKHRKISLKKKLGAYPLPQSQLDLHGYTALKAELRTESYLKSAYHSNTHTVIIIVGRGLHSNEGAVLPDVVEEKLKELKKDKLILAYEWDKTKKSQGGAVTVYLDNLRFI